MLELFDLSLLENIFLISTFVFLTVIILFLKVVPCYLSSFFGECISNNKSSKFHLPMLRGLGIVFPIILIISTLIWENIFNFFEIIIIMSSTLVGFWDDKFGIKQKQKLIIFLFIGFVWALSKINFNFENEISFFKLFLYIFIFVFLFLFFNQIDGINGLASITFLISISVLYFIGIGIVSLLPILISVFAYFVINLAGKIGIQGDAGSFFLGSFAAILFTKTIILPKYGIIFFILGPIIFDVCATTLIRMYYKIDLTLGHRNNLYQKLVTKYQNHFVITLIFAVSQITLNFFLLDIFNEDSIIHFYSILTILGCFLISFFSVIAYLIHKEKILNSIIR